GREVRPGRTEIARGGVGRIVDVLRVGGVVAVAVGAPALPGGGDGMAETGRSLPRSGVARSGGHVARAVQHGPVDLPARPAVGGEAAGAPRAGAAPAPA